MKDVKKVGLVAALITAGVLLILPTPQTPAAAERSPAADDVVAPRTLSDWILRGDVDYFLIDVRPEQDFLRDGIRTASSMPTATLDEDAVVSLPLHRRIVIYGGDTDAAAEAWRRIRTHRPRAYVLEGGLAAWDIHVLHPPEPGPDASEEVWNEHRQRVAAAAFFLGKTDVAPVQRERVVTPVLRPRPAVRSEGC
jgi:rhodanese-related sulfurtransferase